MATIMNGACGEACLLRLEFFVSQDEEHARARLHIRGEEIDLGERAHHYSLVTLARARFLDMQAGYETASQGWIELDDLVRMLGIDASHVNVQIYRARAQLAALPGFDAGQLVERRRGSVRFGALPFRIFRGERLECECVRNTPQDMTMQPFSDRWFLQHA